MEIGGEKGERRKRGVHICMSVYEAPKLSKRKRRIGEISRSFPEKVLILSLSPNREKNVGPRLV